MTMPISILARRVTTAAAVLGLAACADGPTVPRAAARAPEGLNFALIGQASTRQGDTTVTAFTVDPTTATTFQVGSAHAIYFPAHAICDPSVSTYGPSEWDRPCVAMDRPLVITAKSWVDEHGLPQVDFSPSLRFAPDAAEGVQLALAVTPSEVGQAGDDLHINWCASPTTACVNEALADSTLSTWVSPFANAVYRRIKHFSGYNVSSGRLEVNLGIIDLGLSLSRAGNAVGLSSANGSANGAKGTDDNDAPSAPKRTGHLMSSGRTDLR
jgi:hypothetical protein